MINSCIILAGGLGTRLRSAVPDIPKCLAPIGARPFLELQINLLHRQGVSHFIIALGYGSEMVKAFLGEAWANKFSIEYVVEEEELGTGGAILNAMNLIGIEEVLIANGDTLLGGSIAKMLMPLDIASGELMRVATVSVSNRGRYGAISVDDEGFIVAFHEKANCGEGQINTGVCKLNRRVFDRMLVSNFSLENTIIPNLVANKSMRACEVYGEFIDIGIPEDYKTLNESFIKYIE
jgi:D-glycero-alpha-D-manno-heptose 1-phosphate guanylyltransferase